MTARVILEYPDPLLQEPSAAVSAFNHHTRQLVEDLFDTLATTAAIGLSAPQIGELQRVLVIDVPGDAYGPRSYINPEIVDSSGYGIVEESCVSVPDVVGNVIRHPAVRVRAQNTHGDTFEEDIEGMHAVCLQHEIDHLNGMLFIDRLSWLRRLLIRRATRRRLASAAA